MFQLFEKTSAEVHWLKISFRVVWYLSRKQNDHKTREDGKRSRGFPSCPDVSLWCRISHVRLPVTIVHWIRHLGLKNRISNILKWQRSFGQNKRFNLKSWIKLPKRTGLSSKFDQNGFFFSPFLFLSLTNLTDVAKCTAKIQSYNLTKFSIFVFGGDRIASPG